MNPYEAVIKDHIEKIDEHGFVVTYVPSQGSTMAYTSGLAQMGMPEIAVSLPIEPSLTNVLINDLVALWKEKGVSFGLVSELIKDLDVMLCPLDTERVGETEWFSLSRRIADRLGYADKLTYVQLVFPDANGYFPDNPEYDTQLPQPLLV